jgi:hypothetical protein
MLDAEALITKHRAKGVLVDTNLLVLLLVGTVNRQRILNFKRTGDFTPEDYDLLVRLVVWFGKIFSTPHVLSQVSDLTDLTGHELTAVRAIFKALVEQIEEEYDVSQTLMKDPLYQRFGLTDSAIGAVCCRGILVVTTDSRLHVALQERNIDALNFNHIRPLAW